MDMFKITYTNISKWVIVHSDETTGVVTYDTVITAGELYKHVVYYIACMMLYYQLDSFLDQLTIILTIIC